MWCQSNLTSLSSPAAIVVMSPVSLLIVNIFGEGMVGAWNMILYLSIPFQTLGSSASIAVTVITKVPREIQQSSELNTVLTWMLLRHFTSFDKTYYIPSNHAFFPRPVNNKERQRQKSTCLEKYQNSPTAKSKCKLLHLNSCFLDLAKMYSVL